MSYILIHTNYDEATMVTSSWCMTLAESHALAAHLAGSRATEADLRRAIKSNPNVRCIAFYGHGELDNLRAYTEPSQASAALVHATGPGGLLPKELSGFKVYAVACYAGSNLGKALADAGCEFLGYTRQFWIPFKLGNHDSEPLDRFRDVVNGGCIRWLTMKKGKEEVRCWLYVSWDDLIDLFTFGEMSNQEEAFNAAVACLQNKNGLCSH